MVALAVRAICAHGFIWYRGCDECFSKHSLVDQIRLLKAYQSPDYSWERFGELDIIDGQMHCNVQRLRVLWSDLA